MEQTDPNGSSRGVAGNLRRWLSPASAVALMLLAGCSTAPAQQATAEPSTGSSTSAITNDNGVDLVKPGEPCPGAHHASPETLATAADVPVWLPDPAVASSTDAWTCGGGGTPVIMFNDVQLSFEGGWGGVEIPEKWDALAEDYGGTTAELLGRPALVQPATADGTYPEILVVVDGTLIRALGVDGASIQRLRDVVTSIDLTQPLDDR